MLKNYMEAPILYYISIKLRFSFMVVSGTVTSATYSRFHLLGAISGQTKSKRIARETREILMPYNKPGGEHVLYGSVRSEINPNSPLSSMII
jgi:hypothetical protein